MDRFRNWQSKKDGEWYSRGYLPHRDAPGILQAITFRLNDSLPKEYLKKLEDELGWLNSELDGMVSEGERRIQLNAKRRARIHEWLDAGRGSCLLKEPDAAAQLRNVLLCREGIDYNLDAWCIMPNHVHVVVELAPEVELGGVVKAWKSISSRAIRKIFSVNGALWSRGYHDRFIRDGEHLARAIAYAEENPVKAGLVANASDWRWSSAWGRKKES